ncbi:VanZ family protein [Crossiella cryophila]|uniref:Glycopeptide antibiotics resistance protein n=1 Tax=Crossiella cryophila TaxID=43355 RepID=A0A7W7FR70_9PSEU|nr:VanZ family protein [Crossiella cryophila]MBB4674887.1 glycopeptide antibiotics resistance protein [Crossiella cryophila]
MIATYLGSVRTGLLLFLGIGFALLLPMAAVHYRRYGRLEPRRALVLYAFLAYAAIAISLVFLPFPDPVKVCTGVQQTTQFTPFQFIADIQAELAKHNRSGLLAGLTSKSMLSFAFNIALFAPLGVFLRRAFGKGLRTTAAAGLGVSLAFELTQLTGNWGLYPCAYRLFDVDDLIANTGGTLLGFALAPLVIVLPKLAPAVPVFADTVGVPRKLAALAVDLLLSGMFFLTTGGGALVALAPVLLTRVVVPWLTRGWTPGGYLLGYRVRRGDGSPAGLFRLAGREALELPGLWCFVLIAPVLTGDWSDNLRVLTALALCAVLGLVLAYGALVAPMFRRDQLGWPERISGTKGVRVRRRPVQPIGQERIEDPDSVRRLTPTG